MKEILSAPQPEGLAENSRGQACAAPGIYREIIHAPRQGHRKPKATDFSGASPLGRINDDNRALNTPQVENWLRSVVRPPAPLPGRMDTIRGCIPGAARTCPRNAAPHRDRKSTRLNSSH